MEKIKNVSENILSMERNFISDLFREERLSEDVRLHRDKVLENVESKTNEDGKKLFTNDSARRRERDSLLAIDETFLRITHELLELRKLNLLAKAMIDAEKRNFKILMLEKQIKSED